MPMHMYNLKLNEHQPVVVFWTRGCGVAHKNEGYCIVSVLKLQITGGA